MGREKYTDYIMYIVMPTQKIYVLPFFILQSIWLEKYSEWKIKYKTIFAKNYNQQGKFVYTTTNLAIPKNVLFEEIKYKMQLNY